MHGESQARAHKRVLQMQTEGTYVGSSLHGQVSAAVLDRRTGLVYEGVNGIESDAVPWTDLHPTLQQNINNMIEAGRRSSEGGYPNLDRRGQQEEGSPVRDHPHFDRPTGHAEVKALNELLWAREAMNEVRIQQGLPVYPTGPEALKEFYSQTYKPFGKGGPRSTPYCANCNWTMGDTVNYDGRYTGFPPDGENLIDVHNNTPAGGQQ